MQWLGACELGWMMQCDLSYFSYDMCINCPASTATSNCLQHTPPKTNIEPENLSSKRTIIFQTSILGFKMLVFGVYKSWFHLKTSSGREWSFKKFLFISELAKINMGCPKSFSVKGGMGAALLDKPEVGHASTLKQKDLKNLQRKLDRTKTWRWVGKKNIWMYFTCIFCTYIYIYASVCVCASSLQKDRV